MKKPERIKRKKHLSENAEAEINDLQRQGITLTIDEIIWINDLCRKVEDPDGTRPCLAIGEPAPAGNAWLWPFTIASSRWFSKNLPLMYDDGEAETELLAYALAHGRIDGAFTYLQTRDQILQAVREWLDELTATEDELAWAMKKVLPATDRIELEEDKKEKKESEAAEQWDDIIASLVATCGETPDFWQYGVSSDYALHQLDTWSKHQDAIGNSKDPNDPYVVATKNLGRAIIAIKRRVKAEQNG